MEDKETPQQYEAEIKAVMDDLDYPGGIRRNRNLLKEYFNEADDEGIWPINWAGLKKDFALWVVEMRRR